MQVRRAPRPFAAHKPQSSPQPRAPERPRSRRTAAVGALVLAATTAVVSVPLLVGAGAASAQPGQTTTTLPSSSRSFGDIIPEPNSGSAPSSPGDPGGWMQVMMFFLILAALVILIGGVWWTSRRARDRRRAAGLDPIDVARSEGRGVRPPRQATGTRNDPVPAASEDAAQNAE